MHAKQERVGSLNYFNGTLLLTPVYLFFCHQNKSFYLSKQRLFRRHFFNHISSYSQSNESIWWGSTREPYILKKRPCIWTISNGKHGN